MVPGLSHEACKSELQRKSLLHPAHSSPSPRSREARGLGQPYWPVLKRPRMGEANTDVLGLRGLTPNPALWIFSILKASWCKHISETKVLGPHIKDFVLGPVPKGLAKNQSINLLPGRTSLFMKTTSLGNLKNAPILYLHL